MGRVLPRVCQYDPSGFHTIVAWTNQSIGEPLAPGSLKVTLTKIVLDPLQTLPTSMLLTGHYAGLLAEGKLRFMAGSHESVPAGEKGVSVSLSIWPPSGPVTLTYFNPSETEQTVIYLVHFPSASESA